LHETRHEQHDQSQAGAKIMDRNFAGNNLGHRDTIERAYAGENLVEADRPRAALDELENIVANAVSSAEVILCGLESLADRLFGARAEPAGKSGVENSDPGCALGRLHVLTSRLHDRLNRIDAVKNRLVDLA
jgi:hypothetical protein